MPTDLRHDLDYLKRLLTQALRFRGAKKLPEATWTDDIIDYFLYLSLDAIEDRELAKSLVKDLTALEARLMYLGAEARVEDQDPSALEFFVWFLWTLNKLLLFRHHIGTILGEAVSRENFIRRWSETAKRLGL